MFKNDAVGSGLGSRKDGVAINSNGEIQKQARGDMSPWGDASRCGLGHVTFGVPFRHPTGKVTKAVGGVLVGDTNMDVKNTRDPQTPQPAPGRIAGQRPGSVPGPSAQSS